MTNNSLSKLLSDNLELNQSLTRYLEIRLTEVKKAAEKNDHNFPDFLENHFQEAVQDIIKIDKSFKHGALLCELCAISHKNLFESSVNQLLKSMNNATRAGQIGNEMMQLIKTIEE
jgi:uncharacterized protein YicC (UPF0701 family)